MWSFPPTSRELRSGLCYLGVSVTGMAGHLPSFSHLCLVSASTRGHVCTSALTSLWNSTGNHRFSTRSPLSAADSPLKGKGACFIIHSAVTCLSCGLLWFVCHVALLRHGLPPLAVYTVLELSIQGRLSLNLPLLPKFQGHRWMCDIVPNLLSSVEMWPNVSDLLTPPLVSSSGHTLPV